MFLTPIMENTFTNCDPLYSPINDFTQSELMEKFNLAFYEAQAVSKYDIIDTFKNMHSSPKTCDHDNGKSINDDYLIDYFISEDSTVSPTDCDINFDFSDFVEDFDENVRGSFSMSTETDLDSKALTTENSVDLDSLSNVQQFSFLGPPPIINDKKEQLESAAASKSTESDKQCDIKFCEALSRSSLDIEEWSSEIQDIEDPKYHYLSSLPPVGTITKSNFDFNCYVRSVPNNDLGYLKQDLEGRSEFGHLIEAPGPRNYGLAVNFYDKDNTMFPGQNHMILTKSDALSNVDPLLSDSNTFKNTSLTEECTEVVREDESIVPTLYQCKWQNCYKKWSSQEKLVVHIEKCHVEIRRGDEFTCYWEHCPRKTKAFNARYKLLIHMRVHTGEKPNKCPFKGCNKAFSRLENLKIHQRSHTGERPYRCTFTGCTKCFSNSSDRAKHQRTHFDTKPYACQVKGCSKKYTDPSSLRKHVKNHSHEEQLQVKNKSHGEAVLYNNVKLLLNTSKQEELINETNFASETDHTYSNVLPHFKKYASMNVKQDLKNKIERKKIQRTMF